MKRLVVVADDPAVVRANRFALRQAAGFRVVATLDGRASVRAALAGLQPDVVVVNDMCQRTNVLTRIREAGEELPEAKVVLLSGRLDDASFDEAFEAGADAVIARSLHPLALGTLLREVAHGNVVQAPSLPRRSARVAPLRPRAAVDQPPAARTSA